MKVRVSPMAVTLLLLAGCSGEPRRGDTSNTDINAAAADAQGDIDTYAANSLQPAPVASPAPATDPAQAAAARPVPAADGAQAAGEVVRDYHRLIAARHYDQAWRLWADGGQASGMTARQFADSFAKYATYRADIGAPGRIDAGAGQRYVEVPVRVTGTLADRDRPFVLAGTLTLHRVADIAGATAEQRSWRISASSLKPRPLEASAGPAAAAATYRCTGETRVSVRFDNRADTAIIDRGGRDVVLAGQRPASGIWYKGAGYELRGKGDAADFTRPGQDAVACTVE